MSNFSAEVIKRDGEKCRVCALKERSELTAHHLYSQTKYPVLKEKVANGLCLCKSCHTKFHQAYQNQPTTPQLFIHWARKQNLPKTRMEKILNLCLRAIDQFSHQAETQSVPVTTVETVASGFNHIQFPQINLTRYVFKRLTMAAKKMNMSPTELAIHLLEHELECASFSEV